MADRTDPASIPAGPAGATSSRPTEIQVEDLHKSFDGHAVLNGINLTIARGEFVAIVGGSGGGKSVLFKHIIGILRPDKGRVMVADHESPNSPLTDLAGLDDAHMDRLRRHFGVVLQQNALYSGSVHRNVTLALEEVQGRSESEANDIARQAVEAVGLNADEVWNQDRAQLSGGMAKRVAIARALAPDPILMLYDEPTTGLDPESAAHIYDLIKTTHERPTTGGSPRTTLIITHDRDLLFQLQPRVALLHEGQIAFDGNFDSFERSDSPAIKPYLQLMPILHQDVRKRR